jgi:hypothetical protein
MIVKFFCKNAADLIMFDDVARKLLAVLGKEPTARGIILAEEVAEALDRLAAVVAHDKALKEEGQGATVEVPEVGVEPHELVGLGTRAQPLIQMLGRAREKNEPVLWEAAKDFYPPR